MTEYVLGFAFGPLNETVVLIQKKTPAWQHGRLNGIGGHIEPTDTTPLDAMQREFNEEAGMNIATWTHYAVLRSPSWTVHVFKAHNVVVGAARSTAPDEGEVQVHRVRHLPDNVLPNLRWLIPIAVMGYHELPQLGAPILTEVSYP